MFFFFQKCSANKYEKAAKVTVFLKKTEREKTEK